MKDYIYLSLQKPNETCTCNGVSDRHCLAHEEYHGPNTAYANFSSWAWARRLPMILFFQKKTWMMRFQVPAMAT